MKYKDCIIANALICACGCLTLGLFYVWTSILHMSATSFILVRLWAMAAMVFMVCHAEKHIILKIYAWGVPLLVGILTAIWLCNMESFS